ncbi:MAG: hypothetical protein ACRDIX_11245 [Actinomycetota bacterium]
MNHQHPATLLEAPQVPPEATSILPLLEAAPIESLLGYRVRVPDVNQPEARGVDGIFVQNMDDRACRECGCHPGQLHRGDWDPDPPDNGLKNDLCWTAMRILEEWDSRRIKAKRAAEEAEEEARRIKTSDDVLLRFSELYEAVASGGHDSRLGPGGSPTRRVYGAILDRAIELEDKVVIAGRQWLAGEAEVTEKAARYALKRLVDFGYLIRIKDWRRSPSKRANVYMRNRNHEQQGRPPAMFRVRLDFPAWDDVKDYQAASGAKTRAKTGAKTRAI